MNPSLLIVVLFLISTQINAKEKSFIRTYTYEASEADSKITARTIAMAQVKQLLLEELGSYIHSNIMVNSKESNGEFSEITTSQIRSITSAVSQTKLLEEKWNGEVYFLKAEIIVDEDYLKKQLELIVKNKEEMSRLEELQRQSDSAFKEIEELKRKLLAAENEQEKQRLRKEYDQVTGNFQILNNDQPKIEVVFVLDATGSMGGMIANAKDKIYAIATTMAQTEPAPELSIGLIAFRDRSDSYITKQLPLTSDIDELYAQLLDIKAGGGGDQPESVNQALSEAIFNYQWDTRPSTLRLVYLIGDSPPHMDYPQDIKYLESCEEARKKDIVINTIQCGHLPQTQAIWKEIAQNANGEYLSLNQTGNNFVVHTPYDEELAKKAKELDATRMYYGASGESADKSKSANISKIEATSSKSEMARRGIYNVTTVSGKRSFLGEDELIDGYSKGEVEVKDLKEEELPVAMKSMTPQERETYLKKKAEERAQIEKEIKEINDKRQKFIDKELEERKDEVKQSFNGQMHDIFVKQAAKKNYKASSKPSF